MAPAGLAAAGTGGFTGGLVPTTPGLATTGGLGFDATAGAGLAAVAPAEVVFKLFFFHVGADDAPFATTPGTRLLVWRMCLLPQVPGVLSVPRSEVGVEVL